MLSTDPLLSSRSWYWCCKSICECALTDYVLKCCEVRLLTRCAEIVAEIVKSDESHENERSVHCDCFHLFGSLFLSSMEMDAAMWSGLPFEIVEQVLSFLPVPDLCRYRSVCKRWNRLICNPKFAALHTHNARLREASFIVTVYRRRITDPEYEQTGPGNSLHGSCILDLNSRRWYTGLHDDDRRRYDRGYDLIMDGGLACQCLRTTSPSGISIIIHNLIGNSAQVLPTAPDHLISENFPELNMVVDSISQNFQIFLINQGFEEDLEDPPTTEEDRLRMLNDPLMHVYNSATNEWKSMTNPSWINRGAGYITSNVIFQSFLYILFSNAEEYPLRRYNLVEDVWESVAVHIPNELLGLPKLIVTANCLFLVSLCVEGKPYLWGLGDTGERLWFFEVNEIKLSDTTQEKSFKLSKVNMAPRFNIKHRIVYGESHYGEHPAISVIGFGNSFLFMSKASGLCKSKVFDVVAGSWDQYDMPQIPLGYFPDQSSVGKHLNLLLP